MIKIAQIIDKATKGQEFLITYKDEIINQTITEGIVTVICEVIEFDEAGKPITFINELELELDLDNLGSKTIREKLTELAGL